MKTRSLISQLCSQLSYSTPLQVRLGQSSTPEFEALLNGGLLRSVRAETLVCPNCMAQMVFVEPLDNPVDDCHFHAECDECGHDNILTDAQAYQFCLNEPVLVNMLRESLCDGRHDVPSAISACYKLGKCQATGHSLYFACNPLKVDCTSFRRSDTALLISGRGYTRDEDLDRRIVPLSDVLCTDVGGALCCRSEAIVELADDMPAKSRRPQVHPAKPNRTTIVRSRLVYIAGVLQECISAARNCPYLIKEFRPPNARWIADALKGKPCEVGERQARRILDDCIKTYERPGSGERDKDFIMKSLIGSMLSEWNERILSGGSSSSKGQYMREKQQIDEARKEFSIQMLESGTYQIRRRG